MSSSVPAKIGKYNVIDLIGRGGMGVVYRAIDPHLDRQVAIKMMTSGFVDNPDLLKRFFREAQSLGSLQHPNIVTIHDLGDFGGNPYMVMEFMEGEGLDAVLAGRRQLSTLEKINIIVQVCNGLSYAHERGIVHRDIKPANIMLGKDGGVKLFDFGIAHIGDHSVTQTGQIVGTLSYMSPEQVNGKPVDARTDLFSTGVVLYQLFTNHLPFDGENTATTLFKISHDPPPPLKTFLSSYPLELETVLSRALAKDREERYHSADEFAIDLAHLQIELKQELIIQLMQEVGRCLERSNLYKAKEYLIQALKVDQQHVKAKQLLREVQERIKKEEVGEQVRKLHERAKESAARDQFETAQEFVEQALAIDKTNTELLQLRESLKAAALRAEKLHNALRQAETFHQNGELDAAKQAIEEALEFAPDDAQVKTLNRLIQRDWTQRSRQRQLENYLFEARQDISSRKFTAAMEILKLAEELDPHAPQVHALIDSATAGRDQDRRRKDLEAISREIEDALNHDDYRRACEKADQGLARFPEDRTLIKLKALSDRQRQIEERKQFIDGQLAVSRKLLQEGRNEELVTLLENAQAKIGSEPRLQSLLSIVKENVERERLARKKTEFLQKAKESLRNKRYDSAIRTLEGARSELRNEPEIDDLLQFVREEAAAEQRRRIAEAADPGLETHINWVTTVRDQKRAAAKTACVQELQDALGSSELDRACALLLESREQFPGDRDLTRLEDLLSDALKARSRAQKLLADAGTVFEQLRWEKGVDTVNRALEAAPRDAVIRDRAVAYLVRACESAMSTNLASAQMLVERVSKVAPGSPHLTVLRRKIEERQREQVLLEKLANAGRVQQRGDLQGALRELTLALAAYPGDQRFIQAKAAVERELHQLEEERAREREKTRQLGLERERVESVTRNLSNQKEQPRRETEPHVESGQVPEATRVFGSADPSDLGHAGARDVEPRESSAVSPLTSKRFGSSDKQSTSVSSGAERTAEETTEARTRTSIYVAGWDQAILHAIESELAVFVGPLARILVKKNASKTTDPEALYMLLSNILEKERDRLAFLARKSELSKHWPAKSPQALTEAARTVTSTQSLPTEFSPEVLDRATQLIAVHLGPISKILVRKEARKATSLRALYLRLSEHVQDPAARAKFLHDAGF